MAKELAKTYDPKDIENRLYRKWEDAGYFHAEPNPDKKPFTIVMPPPNITGQLHMGHALDNTLQDILIRYKRMQGYEALWQPGTDHASIATEVKIIDALKQQGIDKEDLGREKFLERAWEWKQEYGSRIISQLKKMGSSADWERERFTMDEGCSKAVTTVFLKLYKEGYIYKGSRIINWCPVCQTSISDAEVEHEEQAGHFWHIRYPVVGTDTFLEIATTRPETMLGDTAIAVHPDDDRYRDLVGKKVLLPLVNREIPVVADSYVDREFGTGAVKITPAHDPNDFEVGKRHDLEEINILNDDATINAQGGKYAGMDRYAARKAIVADLEAGGYLVKIEDHVHNVGTHDRCGTTVEPMVKQQWFVRMKELAQPAIKALQTGELRFVPQRFDKIYLNWLNNIRDWCISRQLWWGHRIPAYYCPDCGEMVVADKAPGACPKCGAQMVQDEDTLDTWFSSALWPFSTLGWPEETEELKYFYPTNVLVTGYDIIFFWVIRMVFSGYAHTGKCPFDTVLIHGLVRDSQGRKMSKSLGNGIDPLEVIDQYGADALRMTLVTGNAPGNDMRFYWERVESSRNFANKIWNASRFILMHIEEGKTYAPTALTTEDKWILSACNTLVKDVSENMDKFELGIALDKVYDFLWEEFCDWYIETAKPRLYGREKDEASADTAIWVLKEVLTTGLKLLHPFMPFITEEIFCTLTGEASIMISEWPRYNAERFDPAAEQAFEELKTLVRALRNLRSEMNVAPAKKTHCYLVTTDGKRAAAFADLQGSLKVLGSAEDISIQADQAGIDERAVSVVIPGATVYIPFEELVDIAKERARLLKEEERLHKELERVDKMLGNENFVKKAPEKKIKEEEQKKQKYTEMLEQVKERLQLL